MTEEKDDKYNVDKWVYYEFVFVVNGGEGVIDFS